MPQTDLFLLHFAGGSSLSFRFLMPHLDRFTVHAIELPGRGRRAKENIIDTIEHAKYDVLLQIQDKIVPHESIIYGHSLGALLAFCVVHELEKKRLFPRAIVLSGDAGFGLRNKERIFELDKEEFKIELKKMGGMSDKFFDDAQLFDFYEPILRADIKLAYDFSMLDELFISTPIYAMMGKEEEDSINIDNWNKYTSGSFASELMDGGHFFIYDAPKRIAQILTDQARNNL